MSAVPSFSSTDDADGIPPSHTMTAPPCVTGQPESSPSVSAGLHHRLTDSEREAAIHRAGDLFLHYMAKWDETGDFQYRGDADRALRLQSLLIQGRSPEAAARIAAEEGAKC